MPQSIRSSAAWGVGVWPGWSARPAASAAKVRRVVLGVGGLEPIAAGVQILSEIGLESESGVVGLHDLGPLHVLDLEARLDIGVGPEVQRDLRVLNGLRQ